MTRPNERLLAVDTLRGLVMVLMALDHVDHATNPNHAGADSALIDAGALSAPDFLLRWLTHLCAPTFVLLAGTSIALSAASARHLLQRSAVIIALEFTLVSWYWRVGEQMPTSWLPVFAQVLWAIGGGIALMTLLRRLPSAALLALAAALLVAAELVRSATLADTWFQPRATSLLFTGGIWSAGGDDSVALFVLYPLLAWLPALLFGFVLGRRLVDGTATPRLCAIAGSASLALFLALRGFDGFGNMALHRRGGGLLEWLHCSKYPPSITFFALELGLALLLLAALLRAEGLLARLGRLNPLTTLGRVPMFYYLLHLPVIGALMLWGILPAHGQGSAAETPRGTLIVVLACLPFCAGYAWYKRRYRHAWTRYL
ncbi:MAG: DUF1624 domain-containing protein [Planctomycetes bacterium]|nr:DUF1624 domain-containing protein [Planctomycetota bacterium]